MRDNQFLTELMYTLWDDYFADVPRKNIVLIHFGKYSIRQLGCIRWVNSRSRLKGLLNKNREEIEIQDDKRVSDITITKYFQDPRVPENIVRMVVAHEMVHYAHGFHSPLPKLYDHPHKGNIVNKELIKRGLETPLNEAEKWIEKEWVKVFKEIDRENGKKVPIRRRRRSAVRRIILFPF